MEKDWSKMATQFDDLQKYVVGEITDKLIKEELSKVKNLGNVLEFGCGTGGYTTSIITNSKNVIATDISDDMINVCTKKLSNYKNVEIKKADCYQTNYTANSFDTILMANLIHVVKYPQKTLVESYRLLKKGGTIIIISFTIDGMSPLDTTKMFNRYLKKLGPLPKSGTPFKLESLSDFITKNNFRIESKKLIGNKQSKAMFIIAKKQ